LKSKHPLYGKVKFDPDATNRQGIEFYFVLDKSGETETGKQEKNDRKQLAQANDDDAKFLGSGDSTGGSSAMTRAHKLLRYDRLYFDFNRDLDLSNDRVVMPMKAPPWDALPPYPEGGGKTVFDYLSLKFDYGPGIGNRPLEILLCSGRARTANTAPCSLSPRWPVRGRSGSARAATRPCWLNPT